MIEESDIIVIGGGPAGAAAAIAAANLGCRPLVLEADTFPRHHVGESLVNLWDEFAELGVLDDMERTFQHKGGSTRIWGRSSAIHSSRFEYVRGPRKYSLQVERSLFDAMLLQQARACGAVVREGCRVDQVLWEADRVVGVRYVSADGADNEVRAALVIDASGRRGLVARDRNLRVVDPFYPDMSVYGYFQGERRFEAEEAGNLVIEVVPWGWLWFIPLHTGTVSVGLICDRTSRSVMRDVGLDAYFESAISQSSLVRDLLASARLVRGPIGTASYGYRSWRYAGPGWMMAGDAGAFVDPMWATGVANALQDGLWAAGTCEAILGGRISEERAMAEYDRRMKERADLFHAGVKFVYKCNTLFAEEPFWRERHRMVEEAPVTRAVLQVLASDPSARYFQSTFEGMGVDREILQMWDADTPENKRDPQPSALIQAPRDWVPYLDSEVSVVAGLVRADHPSIPGARGVVEGVEIRRRGVKHWTDDPLVREILQQLDGCKSVSELAAGVLDGLPQEERVMQYVGVLQTLMSAYAMGFIGVRTADGIRAQPVHV